MKSPLVRKEMVKPTESQRKKICQRLNMWTKERKIHFEPRQERGAPPFLVTGLLPPPFPPSLLCRPRVLLLTRSLQGFLIKMKKGSWLSQWVQIQISHLSTFSPTLCLPIWELAQMTLNGRKKRSQKSKVTCAHGYQLWKPHLVLSSCVVMRSRALGHYIDGLR